MSQLGVTLIYQSLSRPSTAVECSDKMMKPGTSSQKPEDGSFRNIRE